MFERFTQDARQIVVRAKVEANGLQHRWIGTEHLLLAMLTLPEPGEPGATGQLTTGPSLTAGESLTAGQLLREAGVEADAVRAEIVRLVGASRPLLDETDAEALRSVGIDLDAVMARIEESFGPEALLPARTAKRGWFGRRRQGGSGRFSDRSKKVLELSLREAIWLHDSQISSGHILLGLLREGSGLAVKILADGGVDLGALQARTEQALRKAA